MTVTYDYYHIFYYVARCRSFTKAAEELHNNQPNITRCINNLEHELGCRLFIRSNKGVVLTSEGEKLFKHVSVAFDELEKGEEEILADEGIASGTVSIGTSDLALQLIILDKLSQFHNTYPGIHLKISNSTSPQAVSALICGEHDYAVITTPAKVEKPLHSTTLMTFKDILICSYENFRSCRDIKSLRDLKNHPLILLGKETSSYTFYKEIFLRNNAEFKVDIEAATMDQVLPMIRHDLGIGFYPESLALPYINAGEICRLELEEDIPERKVCLIENFSKPQTCAMKEFKRILT